MAALANRINPWDLRNTLFVRDVVSPRVDWLETPDAHVFKADLPGVKKEDIKVEVEEGNVLRISGAGSQEDVKETDKWHRIERSRTGFVRRFRLPDNVDLNNVTASVEDGVLQVTVPKIQPKKPQHRLINVEWGRSKL